MGYSDGQEIVVRVPLSEARPEFERRVNKLIDDLQELAKKVDSLPEMWQGKSSSDYTLFQQHWNHAWDELVGPHGVLGAIAYALGVSYENYTDAEFANAKMWANSVG